MSELNVVAEENVEKPAAAESQSSENPAAPIVANNNQEDLQAKYQAAMAELDKQKAEAAKDKERITALESENLKKDLVKIAADNNFAGDQTQKVEFMNSLVEKFGKDSAEFNAYVEDQKALSAQIKTGNLFGEVGSSGADSADAEEKLNGLAKTRSKEKGITFEKAYTQVCEENQELYAQAQQV